MASEDSDPDFKLDFDIDLKSEPERTVMDSSSDDDNKLEVQTLGHIFQHLYEEGLISNLEYRTAVCNDLLLQRRSSIYQLMLSKDYETACSILKTLRQFFDADFNTLDMDSEKSAKDIISINEPKNPLMNETVLKVVYRFLDFKDLKSCRCVCQKWNAAAELTFRNQTKIVFRNTTPGCLSPILFVDTFKYTLPAVPFHTFSFSETWSIKELTSFFASTGKNITDLEFIKVTLKEYRKNSESFRMDISPWIAESKLKSLVIAHCSKLVNVSLHAICSVQKLVIIDAIIHIPDKTSQIEDKITPEAIYLNEVEILRDGENVEEFCINTIIDFNKAKHIFISQEDSSTLITVDLSISKVNAVTIAFDGIDIEVLNWRLSQWEVKKLSLNEIPFLEKSGMTFEILCFEDASIDLFALPQTIKKLKIRVTEEDDTITCSQPINLKNLKLLEISYYNSFSFLAGLVSCENLHELYLRGSDPDPTIHGSDSSDSSESDFCEEDMKIDICWIPGSVKILKIGHGIQFKGDANASCEVKRLILFGCDCVKQWIHKFKYEVLLMEHKFSMKNNDIEEDVIPVINQRRKEAAMYIIAFFSGELIEREIAGQKTIVHNESVEVEVVERRQLADYWKIYLFKDECCTSISKKAWRRTHRKLFY